MIIEYSFFYLQIKYELIISFPYFASASSD